MTITPNYEAELVEALWQFSLAVYARPGVAETCVTLQDQWDVNVNPLLWLLWLEDRGVSVDTALLSRAEEAIADWDKTLVQALRQLRRQVNGRVHAKGALGITALGDCYQALKMAELQAERVTQTILLGLLPMTPRQPASSKALTAGQNLVAYFERLGVPLATRTRLQSLL
jgi:uncharacterized protein (TIGR02444 family)